MFVRRYEKHLDTLENKIEWREKFFKALEDNSFGQLKKMGFVLKLDHEAGNAFIDQEGWDYVAAQRVCYSILCVCGPLFKVLEPIT